MTEPPITIRAAHDSGAGNAPVTRVVIHATCPDVGYAKASAPGTAHGTAVYFATQAAGGSAHYVCGVDGEEHCVPEDVIAWHAPPNQHSLGIEITAEGGDYAKNYTRDQWLSPQVWPAVQRAAARCRDLCNRHGIPLVKLTPADLLAGKHGICGHVDVSQAWHQSTHSDPGNASFPWDRFMAEVLQEDDMPLTDADKAWMQANLGPAAVWDHQVKHTLDVPAPAEFMLVEARQFGSAISKAVAAMAAKDPTQITAADIADAIPADIAQQVADALAKRLAS